ncbi:MAG: Glycosyl transferase, family 2 [Microgenomates group bacterium GW2011_GWC1_43_11]|uniref:Glycosyl transferase, family 2 n=2 Tax=Candidatus Gottesmaniibacteriota TaxID=1752720 RepID=A0A0G1IQI2_9BACT|nr:MAG: Glycosyl transferase, family 2 [Microgenomates group bacterium GW2011_GWC1_43_11]KKT39128.1 MAG: Glycosyl transferase, family 2 [Candidatus Gottesmanbacteria bacterium GW2011_GWB1_44_11c]KKT61601.1 MAG: Glycosyl transferase, family 2 [Candidatus Gottesmanbacteria bacterium GW2011_GWA1_44_24b]
MQKKKIVLSVAMAVKNEESNIKSCLSSIADIADEIVVVDGGSTDRTIEIARDFDAKIIQTDNPPIFHINKQKALDACTGDWILQLDADEIVTPDLQDEILKVIHMSQQQLRERVIDPNKKKLFERHQQLVFDRDEQTGTNKRDTAAFFVPRRNYFLGHPMTYAGTYPDGVIRLVKNGTAHFPSKSVHEQIAIDGAVGWLSHDLIHMSHPTWKKYWQGADRYTSLLSQNIIHDTRNSFVVALDYLVVKPMVTFFALAIRYKGILDGIYGFLFSLFSALHYPIAYRKTKKFCRIRS